jgi:hypothetical protein
MARGRLLHRKISYNQEVASLANILGCNAALFYSWLISHADREGRARGDPVLLKGIVVPRVDACTPDLIEATLVVTHRLKLLLWYKSGGDRYVWFPSFATNQPGLRVQREAPSEIPAPTKTQIEEWDKQEPLDYEQLKGFVASLAPSRRHVGAKLAPSGRTNSRLKERKGKESKGKEGSNFCESPQKLSGTGPDGPAPSDLAVALQESYPEDANVQDPAFELELCQDYPSINLARCVRQARRWEAGKPGREKVDHKAFIRNWIKREAKDYELAAQRGQPQAAAPTAAFNAREHLKQLQATARQLEADHVG